MRVAPLAAAILLASGSFALAKDYRASEVKAADGVVKCNSYRDWYVTSLSGPCSDFVPPRRIAIGEKFSERQVQHIIHFITATHVDSDMTWGDLKLKKGQWTCIAAETEQDTDFEGDEGRRTWLYIQNCQPIR